MDLKIIKVLLGYPKDSARYIAGVEGFVEFAFKNKPKDTKIYCPCHACVHTSLLSRDEIYEHLVCNGILENYEDWDFHSDPSVHEGWDFHGDPSEQRTVDQQPQSQNEEMHGNMSQMLHDAFYHMYDDIPMTDAANLPNPPVSGPNLEAEEFYKLVEDSKKPLWTGCELTLLSLLVLLFNVKSMNKWSDKSLGDLLGILQKAIPNGKELPKNFYEAKKIISKFGLGYESIHACPKDCELFWKDKKNDDFCSKCKASRWKGFEPETKLTKKQRRKATPCKVLRYFPIKDRLKRLFMCKETAPLLRWHDEERIKDGALRHPADSRAWADFDEKFPQIKSDPRNIRFGLATDGFNPYGMLSSRYSCWPVVLVIYNLPPWCCMKEHHLMLSLIIPGSTSPGDKLHVYLGPLLEDLKDLFQNGMPTYDASRKETFDLKAAVLMTISDLPGLGMLASHMVHGNFACLPCGENVWYKRLKHGNKSCFMGHRRFLPLDHPFRLDENSFDGTVELRTEPQTYYGRQILDEITALVAMARGRKKQIIQSHDEYLLEEHIGQGSHGQNTEQSELHSSGSDQISSDGDIDINFHDETEDRVKRGKTKLKDIWNLPKGHRIVVRCNELDQPIGVEAGFLGKFLGMVARNGCLCSLSYKDWRLLIGKKEKNTDEQKNKKDILKQVKMRFLYPSRMEKWILRTIGERWRQHKSNLKSIYFDEHKSTKANHSNVPDGIIADQWIALVDNWTTQKALDISKKNRVNCTKKKSTHTAGTKSFARNREDLREKDPEKKYPHRAVLYIHTHQTKSEKDTNAHVGDLKELIVQQPSLAETSQGKVAWKGDALSKILGEEKPGHVHGLGLVPNPNQVFDLSTSKRLKNVNLTSLDETSSEDAVSLRLEMEKLGQRVRNQDATILQLQQKTRTLEQKYIQEGCLDDPVYAPKDDCCADVPNAKRKRVYSDIQSEDCSMDVQLNYTMTEQGDHVEIQDLPTQYKYNCTKDKVVSKETSATPSNFEASYHQNKISARPSATIPASKHHRGISNLSSGNSMTVGTKVYLQSWKNQNKTVALGTLLSCDPTQKLDGVQLGKEFWMVSVSFAMVEDEPLIRPYKTYKVLRDVEGGVYVAWPSTFIKKINM